MYQQRKLLPHYLRKKNTTPFMFSVIKRYSESVAFISALLLVTSLRRYSFISALILVTSLKRVHFTVNIKNKV
jgi:hypothetical protein